MIELFTPGKLMLSGEWSILRSGNACIAMPTKQRNCTRIAPAKKTLISSPDFGIKDMSIETLARQSKTVPSANFLHTTANTAIQYLQAGGIPLRSFKIETDSSDFSVTLPNHSVHKLGLGSSASSCTGIIKAILQFHEIIPPPLIIFKLAAVAHSMVQDFRGSGYDIAVAAFGTCSFYRSFDQQWLRNALETSSLNTLIDELFWPGLEIKELPLLNSMQPIITFSGQSASTTALMAQFHAAQATHSHEITTIFSEIQAVVHGIADALISNSNHILLDLIRENRRLLQRLSTLCGNIIETPALAQLCDQAEQLGAAAKLSGAGGGDCVIGFVGAEGVHKALLNAWAYCL